MIKRRSFLLGGLGVLGLAALGVWGFGRSALESEIVSILRRRLSFLKLDEEGLHAYAKDQIAALLAKRPSLNRLRYHFVSAVGPSFKRFQRSADTRGLIERTEDQFVSTYLISSDFFFTDADPSRLVRYRFFYDALSHPCASPFARPLADEPSRS